jgi:hypothetical protein
MGATALVRAARLSKPKSPRLIKCRYCGRHSFEQVTEMCQGCGASAWELVENRDALLAMTVELALLRAVVLPKEA